jgi:uncharacterized RDD family membrane protein YckC
MVEAAFWRGTHVREALDTTTDFESPEHMRFQHHVAGPAKRALAYLIDLILRAIIVFGISILAAMAGLLGGLSGGDFFSGASTGLILLVMFAVEWGYYVLCESLMSGRTPGKAALRLRVVTDSGHPLQIVDSLLRNLLRAADFLPAAYALGALVMGRDPRFRRLGDLVAGTMVVVEQRHTVSGPLHIHPPPTAQELARIPQRLPLSGDDLDAIELYLRRTGTLSPMRELELAEMVAPIFARRIGVNVHNPQRLLQLLYHRARGEQTVDYGNRR